MLSFALTNLPIQRYPVPGEVLYIVDISDNHQIQMWRGDLAELRQYQFAFVDTDGTSYPST